MFSVSRNIAPLCQIPFSVSCIRMSSHYRLLFINHWRFLVRSFRRKARWMTVLAISLVLLYLTFVLVGMGYFFREIFLGTVASNNPVTFINMHLLEIFLGLFSLRFFLQRSPNVKTYPFLTLPIESQTLVRFFQAVSFFSLHNILPFLFFIPFWYRYLYNSPYPEIGVWYWFSGIVLMIGVSHLSLNLVRSVLKRSSTPLFWLLSIGATFFVLDKSANIELLPLISQALFERMLLGSNIPLIILGGSLVLLGGISAFIMHKGLYSNFDSLKPSTVSHAKSLQFRSRWGQVVNLILLEIKLMMRNKRPKHYVILSIIFAIAYITLMLTDSGIFEAGAISAVIGLFASGTFALNYGQLMFSWDSSYFDGFLVRNVKTENLVLAKLMLLQGSCLSFFLISLPLFIWLKSDLLLLHVAFLFYNSGVTSVLMMALAVRNRRRINIERSGSFFNYEGFSPMHWLWIIPTIAPPAILLYFINSIDWMALLLIGGIGVASLVLSMKWSRLFTRQLLNQKYAMALGFRTYEN